MLKKLAILFSTLPLLFSHSPAAHGVTIACDSLGKKKEQCVASVKAWEKETGLKAKIVEAPTGSSNRLTWVQQQLASASPDIDVYQIDAPWAGLLQKHLIPLNSLLSDAEKQQYHPTLLENNTVKGNLLALPWYVDIGLLIYRKDLLDKYGHPVPTTWQALETTAKDIQQKERAAGNPNMWGFVFSGKAFEGLSCFVNEMIRSIQGAVIIEKEGKVRLDHPDIPKLLTQVASWIGTLSPKGVLNYAEEDNRGVFQSGNAVFIRHWPYVISLAEADESPLKGKIGVAPLPKHGADGNHAGILGGWQLAVSKYSPRQEAAKSLVKYLTSAKELKARGLRGGYYPPMPHLYEDKDLRTTLPEAAMMLKALNNVVARPSAQTGLKYNQASAALWNTAHKVFLKKVKAEKGIEMLKKRLNFISRKGKNWH